MNLNELIKKYEEKIEINEEYKKSDRSYSVFYEEDIKKYAEFIKDLEELKEKIMHPDDYYVDNDNCCYIRIEEIIGVDSK